MDSRVDRVLRVAFRVCIVLWLGAGCGGVRAAQTGPEPYEPRVGQPGKDLAWEPTPPRLVEMMLDLARVTAGDYVIDLGSGDGRIVIEAARRGARGLGIEYNPDLVDLSRRLAAREGVADNASFVRADMFESDLSQATVVAAFLLPEHLIRLRPRFLALKPGTRIVANATYAMGDWHPDAAEKAGDDCTSWCMALLWIVPAAVGGTWRLPDGQLTLTQDFQFVSGTLSRQGVSTAIAQGRLYGDRISWVADGAEYTGRVTDATMEGAVTSAHGTSSWHASRSRRSQ